MKHDVLLADYKRWRELTGFAAFLFSSVAAL